MVSNVNFKLKEKITFQVLILGGCVFVVAYLALIPLLMLLFNSIRSAPPGEPGAFFTVKNYLEAYLDPKFFFLWKNTFYFALGSFGPRFTLGF